MNGCHPNEEEQIMEDPEYEYYDLVYPSRYNQFEIFVPDFVLDYLKTIEYPKCYKYRGLSIYSYSPCLVPFTKGIDLTEEDLDSLARISIRTFLKDYDVNDPIFFLEQLCSISVEIDFFVLPFLSKPSVNAPNDIIKFMEIFSKQARIKEDFQYYFAFPYDYESETNTKDRCKVLPLFYDYSQLETDNPFKKVLVYLKIIQLDNKPDSQINDESNKTLDLTGKSKDNKSTNSTQKTQCIESITKKKIKKTNYQTNKSVYSIRKDQGTDPIFQKNQLSN
ncbi:hypothetical protein TVAG_335870 [Trichomonas vaginalis G3]|uniref:Uncharacterized protein n=1 Tax=Trichomonas vaginalis (strain ATCC PRA-98 / G3) TaxID=412133 RepID=A2FQ90_TRIV3|nr:hypothetical protein TVAGG3_0713740 [Trichomonas vaginalis G3]EAX92925.1 hypothetical protein TVAG_335870 [Trichomonas vaginalis G3]KAI5510106.1 hypothetical protein TVAGG3_0713740 [Trichomonas vaginalis G3]|eukprot:XP_001305855.1 hypothetical protein [Trichomonas vaginalis G3]